MPRKNKRTYRDASPFEIANLLLLGMGGLVALGWCAGLLWVALTFMF